MKKWTLLLAVLVTARLPRGFHEAAPAAAPPEREFVAAAAETPFDGDLATLFPECVSPTCSPRLRVRALKDSQTSDRKSLVFTVE